MSALAICAVVCATAQETTFKPFKVDLAFGYATPMGGGEGAKGGAILAVEPKYALNDNITLGLRMELAVLVRLERDAAGNYTEEGDVKASSSYLATADYYFNTNSFRPFIGAGVGVFGNASTDLSSTSGEPATSTQFGFAPRAGFEAGHFRTALESNFAGKSGGLSNNYLGIKLGFFFGGGRY
ncbi:MAG: hypothetical protein JWQ96_3479 [Segetibacter sp.]|nr:hypothetical protein [Segetibacter sp.]